jgi:hypothetical protein
LIAEGVQKPVENLGRVTNSDRLKDTGLQHISADVIKKRQRARQATNPSDQINGAMIVLGDIVGASTSIASLGCSIQFVSWDRFQIRDTNLRWASLSPSM